MAAALINPKVAAEQLGHASAALTLDRYTHVSTGQRARGGGRRCAAHAGGNWLVRKLMARSTLAPTSMPTRCSA